MLFRNTKYDADTIQIRVTKRQYRIIVQALHIAKVDILYDKELDKKMQGNHILYEFSSKEVQELQYRLEDRWNLIERIKEQD